MSVAISGISPRREEEFLSIFKTFRATDSSASYGALSSSSTGSLNMSYLDRMASALGRFDASLIRLSINYDCGRFRLFTDKPLAST